MTSYLIDDYLPNLASRTIEYDFRLRSQLLFTLIHLHHLHRRKLAWSGNLTRIFCIMSPSNSQKEIKYQSLAPDEGEDSNETLLKSHNSHSVNSRLVLIGVPAIVAFVIALVLGWFAGQHFSERKADGLICKKPRVAHKIMKLWNFKLREPSNAC